MSKRIDVEIPGQYHAFLDKHFLAMLTTIRTDGMLSTNPIGYVWDGRRIRVSTLKSRMKCRNILGMTGYVLRTVAHQSHELPRSSRSRHSYRRPGPQLFS